MREAEETNFAIGDRNPATYKPGDKIRVQLSISDKSGVRKAAANFLLESGEANNEIILEGKGGRGPADVIILEREVTKDTVPGDYRCFWIMLTDNRGNERIYGYPLGLEFRVESPELEDYRGPELLDAQIIGPEYSHQRVRVDDGWEEFTGKVVSQIIVSSPGEEERMDRFLTLYETPDEEYKLYVVEALTKAPDDVRRPGQRAAVVETTRALYAAEAAKRKYPRRLEELLKKAEETEE